MIRKTTPQLLESNTANDLEEKIKLIQVSWYELEE
jgi:hypothetical protein